MGRFVNSTIVPPGGRYFYETPDTKCFFKEPTMSGLLRAIDKHYRDSGILVPPSLSELVEEYMCKYLPSGFCTGKPSGDRKIMGLSEIKEKTLKAIRTADTRAPVGDVKERAAICGNCPKNNRSMCPSCIGLVGWAERQVGTQFVNGEKWLGVCEVDAVALPAKIHLNNAEDDVSSHPDHCWKHKKGS